MRPWPSATLMSPHLKNPGQLSSPSVDDVVGTVDVLVVLAMSGS